MGVISVVLKKMKIWLNVKKIKIHLTYKSKENLFCKPIINYKRFYNNKILHTRRD